MLVCIISVVGFNPQPVLLAAAVKYRLQKEGTLLTLNIINIYFENVLAGAESSTIK